MLRLSSILCAVLLLGGPCVAAAQADDIAGARALGMGDALRAAAVGSAGLHLNPSGITLVRGYVIEAAYGYRSEDGLSTVDTSIVDTLTSRLGAGVFFSYLTGSPRSEREGLMPAGEKLERSGYQAGLSLAMPFAEFLHIGLTGKYVSISTKRTALANMVVDEAGGFTMDAGATVRLGGVLNLAVAGRNFVDTDSREAPATLGFGAALTVLDGFLVDFDTDLDFTSFVDEAGQGVVRPRYALGVELFTSGVALRGGYVNDRGGRVGPGGTAVPVQFGTFGLSLIGKGAALDAGIRQQVSGDGDRETLFNVGIRLFVQ